MLKGATGFLLRGTGFHIVIHAKKRTTDLEHSMRTVFTREEACTPYSSPVWKHHA